MSASAPRPLNLENLPVFPKVSYELFEKLQSPSATVSEITRILSTDSALTAKVLRLANSGYYSIPGGVKEVRKALEFLGFNTIAQIVLTSSVTHLFRDQSTGFSLSDFWRHSLAIAVAGELVARAIRFKNPSEVFTCGLLYHIGKLVWLEINADTFTSIQQKAKINQLEFDETALQLRKATSVELGQTLIRYWKLPPLLGNCISHHEEDPHPAIPIIRWASLWVRSQKIGDSGDYREMNPGECQFLIQKIQPSWDPDGFKKQFEDLFKRAEAFLHG